MYRVRTSFIGIPGAPYLNTLYFRESAGSAQDAADAASSFWTDIAPVMSNVITAQVESDVAVVDESNGEIQAAFGVTTAPIAGGDAGQALPRAAQGLLRWLTGFYVGGRQIRGRTFIPGMTENSSIAGGVINPASALLINNAATDLLAEPDAQLVIYSPTVSNAYDVASGSTWNEFAVLRSRRD